LQRDARIDHRLPHHQRSPGRAAVPHLRRAQSGERASQPLPGHGGQSAVAATGPNPPRNRYADARTDREGGSCAAIVARAGGLKIQNPAPVERDGRSRHALAIAVFLVATLAMFGDALFVGHGRILSAEGEDLWSIFYYWDRFAFGELVRGNLVLWNPYNFAG